jgi:hypothetical protein
VCELLCIYGRAASGSIAFVEVSEDERGPNAMNVIPEISIDLTAQELLDPEPPVAPIEVDDICEFEPLIAPPAISEPYDPFKDDDTVEIELSAEQVDAVLGGLSLR